MFIMMNAARFAVGVQGMGVAERAYQHAVAYAKERIQGRDLTAKITNPVPIIRHPDVRRMLMWMKANIEGARALAFTAAGYADLAKYHDQEEERNHYRALYEFCVPLVKGWSTEMAVDVSSQAVQVHGGMGYIEETGIAQLFRDARITTIYEGTTAIQANDFIGRKTAKDAGQTAHIFLDMMQETVNELKTSSNLKNFASYLKSAMEDFEVCVNYVVSNSKTQVKEVFAGSVPYLKLAGILLSAWQMARAALAAQACLNRQEDSTFSQAKIDTVLFYLTQILPQTTGLRIAITQGGEAVMRMNEDMF
jgi:butyryl-CoA dehydrogenase